MAPAWRFLTLLPFATIQTLGDVNVVYGALSYANLPLGLQSMARLIDDEMLRNVNAFAANRIADILKNADGLAHLGAQRAKTEHMTLAEDWDRLLWGLIETLKIESMAACREGRIEPALCDEINTVGEMYLRHSLCDEVRDADWRLRVCPDLPMNSRDTRDPPLLNRPNYRFRAPPSVTDLPPLPYAAPHIVLLNSDEPSLPLDEIAELSVIPNPNEEVTPTLKEFDPSIFD
eukprot:Blabericola_migrator_1__4298@NODE_231_length_11072_cov_42_680509_g190_i1_p6_GENE_NODE_231_length_11072_cov_42_680509_g190_i1NODE_231_length_11072_cov_42_680509_g190_i1_p6_ORF_typecomplete_len232_score43_66_NODE_231_length_11072_cov_42_680509_g190_i177768471